MLRALLAIRQKFRKPRFWKVSFVLLAYASLAASKTLLHRLLACLNFDLDSDGLFCLQKRKKFTSMNYNSSNFSTTMAQKAENHKDG